MERSAHEVLRLWVEAMNRGDVAALHDLLAPDYVEDYPQSGERIRGAANLRAIIENYPGGTRPQAIEPGSARIVGAEDRWVVTPTFSLLRVIGSGDQHTAWFKVQYPDGSEWYAISIFTLRDGRLHRMTTFFAPRFEAPEWRRRWVERIPGEG